MSYFTNKIIYIIIPTEDLTEEMVNNGKKDFNSKQENLRKNNDNTKTLFKVKSPVSAVFNGYKWFNREDILLELAKPEWLAEI